jgi:hypothetical protein
VDEVLGAAMILRGCIFLVSIVASAILGVWVSDRQPARVLLNGDVIPNPIEQGGEMMIGFDAFQLKTRCRSISQRTVIDSSGIKTEYEIRPAVFDDLTIGFHHLMSRAPYVLPIAVAVGEARTYADILFYCNPLHELWPIRYRIPELKFMIVSKK